MSPSSPGPEFLQLTRGLESRITRDKSSRAPGKPTPTRLETILAVSETGSYHMKKIILPITSLMASAVILTGCIAAVGNRVPSSDNATLGQQLIDLQKAKDSGALTDAEYEHEKSKLLGETK